MSRPEASEVDALPGHVWPRNSGRAADGVVRIGGVAVDQLAAEFGTPLFVVDEADFRGRCREMADAFDGAENVNYASKAFLSAEIARWIYRD